MARTDLFLTLLPLQSLMSGFQASLTASSTKMWNGSKLFNITTPYPLLNSRRIDEEQMNEIMEDLPEDDLNGLPSKHTTDYGNLLDNINRQIRKFQFSRWVDHLFPEDTEEKKDVLKEEDDEMMMEQKRRELTMQVHFHHQLWLLTPLLFQNLLDTEAERNNYQGDDGVELELLDALEFDDDRDLDEDAESSEKKSGEEAEEKSASETPENDLGDSVFAADNSEAGQKPDVSTKSIQKVCIFNQLYLIRF